MTYLLLKPVFVSQFPANGSARRIYSISQCEQILTDTAAYCDISENILNINIYRECSYTCFLIIVNRGHHQFFVVTLFISYVFSVISNFLFPKCVRNYLLIFKYSLTEHVHLFICEFIFMCMQIEMFRHIRLMFYANLTS